MDYLDILREGSEQLNIELNDAQVRKFDTYLKQLIFFNRKFNLTAITDPAEVITKHFLDSLSVLRLDYIKDGHSLADIGAGAGFPGLALKIAKPKIKLTLIEANRKKSLFLDYIIGRLRLRGASVVNLRVEEFGQSSGRSQFDAAITRALSTLPTNLEYAIPLLKKGGIYLAMKGKLEKEPSTDKVCEILGCKLLEAKPVQVPFLEADRNMVIFQKVAGTDPKYPRKAGTPQKSPL